MRKEITPVEPEAIHIDNLISKCGFFTSETNLNNGYGCKFPAGEEKQIEGCCYTFDCPFAHEADEEDFEKFGLGEDYDIGTGMMIKYCQGVL